MVAKVKRTHIGESVFWRPRNRLQVQTSSPRDGDW